MVLLIPHLEIQTEQLSLFPPWSPGQMSGSDDKMYKEAIGIQTL